MLRESNCEKVIQKEILEERTRKNRGRLIKTKIRRRPKWMRKKDEEMEQNIRRNNQKRRRQKNDKIVVRTRNKIQTKKGIKEKENTEK